MKKSIQDVKINRAFKKYDAKYKEVYLLDGHWENVPRVLLKYISLVNDSGHIVNPFVPNDETALFNKSLKDISGKEFCVDFYLSLSCILLDDTFYKKQNKSQIKFMESLSEPKFKDSLALFQKATILNPEFDAFIRTNIKVFPEYFQNDLLSAISTKECMIAKVANAPNLNMFNISDSTHSKEGKVIMGFYKSPKKILDMTLKKGGDKVADIITDIFKKNPESVVEKLSIEHLNSSQKLKEEYLKFFSENLSDQPKISAYTRRGNIIDMVAHTRSNFLNYGLGSKILAEPQLLHVIKEDQKTFDFLVPFLKARVPSGTWEGVATSLFNSLGGEFNASWSPVFDKTKIIKKLIAEKTDMPEYLKSLSVLNPGLSQAQLNKNVVPNVVVASITSEQSNSPDFWTNFIAGFNNKSKYSESLKKKIQPMLENTKVYDELVKSGTAVAGVLLILFKVDRDIQSDLLNNVKANLSTYAMIPAELRGRVSQEVTTEAISQYAEKGRYKEAFAIVSSTEIYKKNFVDFEKAMVLTYFDKLNNEPKSGNKP